MVVQIFWQISWLVVQIARRVAELSNLTISVGSVRLNFVILIRLAISELLRMRIYKLYFTSLAEQPCSCLELD